MIQVPPEVLKKIFFVFATNLHQQEVPLMSSDLGPSSHSLCSISLVSKLWNQTSTGPRMKQIIVRCPTRATEIASRLANSTDPDYQPKSLVMAHREVTTPFNPNEAMVETTELEKVRHLCKQLDHLEINSGWYVPESCFESNTLSG